MKYQIVRVEPTKAMRDAAFQYLSRAPFLEGYAEKLCEAMLQASPPAPSVEEIKQFILEAGQEIEFASRAHALLAQFEAMEKDDAHLS